MVEGSLSSMAVAGQAPAACEGGLGCVGARSPPAPHLLSRRSLGVTLWELFELGAQPYPHHSDGQVLAFAVREQQLKLPRPQLPPSLSERW